MLYPIHQLLPTVRSSLAASATIASGVSRRGGSRGLGRRRRRRVVHLGLRGLVEKVPVDHSDEDEADDAHGDHRLQVLQPELVLERGRALLELRAAVLQGVGALLQSRELRIALKSRKKESRKVSQVQAGSVLLIMYIGHFGFWAPLTNSESVSDPPVSTALTCNSTHTFSMFLPMMPMTSSTCSCCCFIFLAAWICLICSGPGIGFPSGPSGRSPFSAGGPPGAPAAFSSPPFPDMTLEAAARIGQKIGYLRKSNSMCEHQPCNELSYGASECLVLFGSYS